MPGDARSAGLGGAGVAVVENATATEHNPAAIALVPRSELGGSLAYQRRSLTSGYFGAEEEASLSSASFSQGSFALPVPVYRGAFGIGGSFRRAVLFDRDLIRAGTQPGGATESETLSETGSLDAWTLGAGIQISPRAFLGASLSLLTGALERSNTFRYTGSGSPYTFEARTDLDLSGFTGSFGALVFPNSRTRVGLRFDLPHTVEFDGVERREGASAALSANDEVRYPPSVTAGVAGLAGPFLLTGEATFRPYSLLELDGERLRTEDRREGYRDIVVVRAGVEHRTSTGVRLRLGYRFDPDPFRLVIAEVRDDDPQEAVMEDAAFDEERHVLTAGAGFLVEDALVVDLAADWGKTTKAGSHVDQSDDIARFFLTTSYRF